MVNATETFGVDPAMGHRERALAFGYAPEAARAGLLALFALDAALARLARGTRDPVVAQLRLAWWRDRLLGIQGGSVRGQPILAALHDTALPRGVTGGALARVVDGWEALVAEDVAAHGRDRGRPLFEAAARVLGAADAWVGDAGEGWALADVATRTPLPAIARQARERAGPLLAALPRSSRAARPLGALALVARMDLVDRPAGSSGRIMRLVRFRLTGV